MERGFGLTWLFNSFVILGDGRCVPKPRLLCNKLIKINKKNQEAKCNYDLIKC